MKKTKSVRILSNALTLTTNLPERDLYVVKDAAVLPWRTGTTLPKEVYQRMAKDIISEIEITSSSQLVTEELPMKTVEEINVPRKETDETRMRILGRVNVQDIFNVDRETADMTCYVGSCYWKTSV